MCISESCVAAVLIMTGEVVELPSLEVFKRQLWCLVTWFSAGLSSVRLMVGLDDLKDLFQPI